MLQFYYLSVSTLVLAGVALIGATGRAMEGEVTRVLNRTWIKLGLGSTALIVGVVKLFVGATPETGAVVGDLLPAVAGIAVGLALAAEAWVNRHGKSEQDPKESRAASFYRIPLGIIAAAAGVAHFLLPGVVIL